MKRKSKEKSDSNTVTKAAKQDDSKPAFHYSDNKESLYRPPTSEELNSLKETESLFHSSLLHMQINELLAEVCLRKRKKKLEETLHSLNELLMSLPDGDQQDISDLSWLPSNVRIPLPTMPGPVKGKFTFEKPESVNVIGSYQLGTLCKQEINVDIAVQLPKGLIHSKDYLNLRYHYKRGIYLAILASFIKKSKLFKNVAFSCHNGELWKPILLLKPKGQVGEKVTIKVFITLGDGAFKLPRFSPKINNLQYTWFFGQEDTAVLETLDPVSATSHYNTSILTDMLMEKHLHFLYGKIAPHQSLIDAIVLCKIWIHQRRLDEGFQGFSGFHCAMVIAYLLQTHQISQHMSSYQIIRIFWQFLATKDLTTSGVSLVDGNASVDDRMPSITEFHDHFEVVFLDSSGVLNLLANMTETAFRQFQSESRRALDILQHEFVDSFDVLFMKSISLVTRYDNFFLLEDVAVLKNVVKDKQLNSKLLNFSGDWLRVGLTWLEKLLSKALDKRIDMLSIWPITFPEWQIKQEAPLRTQCSIVVGYHLNTDTAHSVLEKGPNADNPEAKTFREFWGEKSELRRFQDGSISEAVVWDCANACEKRKICQKIIKYILHRHGCIDSSKVLFSSEGLDSLLKQNVKLTSSNKKNDQHFEHGTGEEANQAVIRSYESLVKLLRNLDLPLSLHSVQGLSPVLRGTEVFPAVPLSVSDDVEHDNQKRTAVPASTEKCPPWCPANEVLIQLETSGQWPDDLEAIQRIKAAFLLNIANILKKEHRLPAVANTKHVDVFKDGYVFRVKLAHYREMVLLNNCEKTGPTGPILENTGEELERLLVHLPLLSSVIHGIQQQYVSFGGSVRLAKRWISSHMLLACFPEECIELIMAHIYLHPHPYNTPASPTNGFIRFLYLLSTFDWKSNAMILNFNDKLKVADFQEIQSHFTNNRARLPAMFIATSEDKHLSYWTRDNPSSLILHRVAVLAKESYTVLQNQLLHSGSDDDDLKLIFRPSLEDYDVTILLHERFNPRRHQAIDSTKHCSYQLKPSSTISLPVINFDPSRCYFDELKQTFSDVAMFFRDVYGGDKIGVVWKPECFQASQFKVFGSQYRIPTEITDKNNGVENTVVPNIQAILSDFKTIGQGLVKNVEVRNPPV
ncbi:Nucleolar 6 [Paramuricea clavata]|nr:Nucleolar 6 [Paramuricea clavata]